MLLWTKRIHFCMRTVFLCFCLLRRSGVSACVTPSPDPVKEVLETEDQGYALFTMSGSNPSTSWALTVIDPVQHSTQLESYFRIRQSSSGASIDWEVVLEKPLDIEEIYQNMNFVVTSISVKLMCTGSTTMIPYQRIIIVTPVSEFPPYFTSSNPVVSVDEDNVVGATLTDLSSLVADDDIRGLGDESDIKQFILNTYTGDQVSGDSVFDVTSNGDLRLLREVDYEKGDRTFYINVTVEDQGGLSTWGVIQIDINNVNDNPPVFTFSGCTAECEETDYRATVDPSLTGPITSVSPGPINAIDADTDDVIYNLIAGSPANYSEYITIDHTTGALTLTRSLVDFNISHISLVVEAQDVSTLNSSSRTTVKTHSAATSLLILVSGREVQFPAVPTRSAIAGSGYDEDALFVSAIVLAILLLAAIIAIVTLGCRLHRQAKDDFYSSRCHTLKEQKPSNFEVHMRPVPRGSEKTLMRSLSDSAHSNKGFSNAEENEIFATENPGYYGFQNVQSQRSENPRTASPQLVPLHDALPLHDDISFPSRTPSGIAQNRQSSQGKQDDLLSSDDTQLKEIDAGALQSQYLALDLLTSVTPFMDSSGADPVHHSAAHEDGSVGTVHSFKDVISELEQIVANQRVPSDQKAGNPSSDLADETGSDYPVTLITNGDIGNEEVTSFMHASDLDNALVPYEGNSRTSANSTDSLGLGHGLFKFDQTPLPGNPFTKEIKQQSLNNAYRNKAAARGENHSEMLSMSPGLSAVYPMEENPHYNKQLRESKKFMGDNTPVLVAQTSKSSENDSKLTIFL